MKYIVSEIQSFANGQVQVLNYSFDAREDGEAKFYTLCAGGCKTSLPNYTITLFTDEGFILDTKNFKHNVQPEPEQEPEVATVEDSTETQTDSEENQETA